MFEAAQVYAQKMGVVFLLLVDKNTIPLLRAWFCAHNVGIDGIRARRDCAASLGSVRRTVSAVYAHYTDNQR